MGKGKFILGTVLGAAAGVVAGMLTAPQSGEETRADLKAKAAELKEESARRAASLDMPDTGVIKTIKDKAGTVVGSGKKAVDEPKDEDPKDS